MTLESSFRSLSLISEVGRRCTSKRQLIGRIVRFRMFVLLAMALSCHVIPDHNPGDDVLRFDMRLLGQEEDCFCLKGHICEGLVAESSDSRLCAMSATTNRTQAPIWHFFLAPLTKWDAARFLNLALDPTMRDPKCDDGTCHFDAAEQAHAFFPMFPTILGRLGMFAAKMLPSIFLPPTFEALLVLFGLVFNMFCLVVSTLCLFHLTMSILPPSMSQEQQTHLAMTTCLVYGIWNPASVFFATNYSESLFSATTLLGHYLFQWQSRIGFGLAIAVWTMGSLVRSNGILQSLWLFLFALASICAHFTKRDPKTTIPNNWGSKRLVHAACAIFAAVIIAKPMKWHNLKGIQRFCQKELTPEWCSLHEEKASTFSLYSYVQRQHWNVGFLRYYELKQIPNFLLAAPILLLSIQGVIQWIHWSLKDFGKGKFPLVRMILTQWPIHALALSVSPNNIVHSTSRSSPEEWLVHNPVLLAHYAILAIVALIGIFVAHVQISTRMILSSSPAAIWFLTYLVIQTKQPLLQLAARLYPCLYILLGILLHVNFLPWT